MNLRATISQSVPITPLRVRHTLIAAVVQEPTMPVTLFRCVLNRLFRLVDAHDRLFTLFGSSW